MSWADFWDNTKGDVYDFFFAGSDNNNFLDNILDGLGNVDGESAAQLLGALAGYTGLLDSEAKRVGYQGKIPRYTAVRSQVPGIDESAALDGLAPRRPGSTPVRYFTDVRYAGEGEGIPTLADAQNADFNQNFDLEIDNLSKLYATQQGQRHSFSGGGLVDALSALRAGASGHYLKGVTDGMADNVPGSIDGKNPAALSHGEVVVPADVVSHMGNGNSDAGANELEKMFARVRAARTGRPQQAPQVNPQRMMPR